jgi:hypothetical protein
MQSQIVDINNADIMHNNTYLDLKQAKNALQDLNTQLNCINYNVSIDYAFNLKNTEVYSYSKILTDNLLICIFTNDNVCVSSLELNVDIEDGIIEINSRTKEEFQKKQMNKLLRTIIVLIATQINSNITVIKSSAVNPISAHLMINTLNAIPYEEDSNDEIPIDKLNTFSKIKAFMGIGDENTNFNDTTVIDTKLFLTNDNILNAKRVFDNVIANFCLKNIPNSNNMIDNIFSTFWPKNIGGTKRRKKHNHSYNLYKTKFSRKNRRATYTYAKIKNNK